MAPRSEVIAAADVVLLPKLQAQDLEQLSDGQVLRGWPHCVQDPVITQLAVDKSLTLIAFEAMNHWTADGGFGLHVFHKNNELAGYSSVLHAPELAGSDAGHPHLSHVITDDGREPLAPYLAGFDLAVNCTLQDLLLGRAHQLRRPRL